MWRELRNKKRLIAALLIAIFAGAFAYALSPLLNYFLMWYYHRDAQEPRSWEFPQDPWKVLFPYRPAKDTDQQELAALVEEAIDSGLRLVVVFVWIDPYLDSHDYYLTYPPVESDLEEPELYSWDALDPERELVTGRLFACMFERGFSLSVGDTPVYLEFGDLDHHVVYMGPRQLGLDLIFLGKGVTVLL